MAGIDLKHYKKLLLAQMKDLQTHGADTLSSMIDRSVEIADPIDRATEDASTSYVLRIRDREKKLISKIQAALDRIEDGTFGYCDECGDEIGKGRLEARPVTTLCIECKTKQEKYEKSVNE
jgi:DnaK suppressor protein